MYPKLILIVMMVIGVFLTIQLLGSKQFFQPKAFEEPIVYLNVSDQNGQKVTDNPQVEIKLTSPYGPTSPNVLGEETSASTDSGILDYVIDALTQLREFFEPEVKKPFPLPTPTPVPFSVPAKVVAPTVNPVPTIKKSTALSGTPSPTRPETSTVADSPTPTLIPTQAPVFTTGYRVAESESELSSMSYNTYSSHPLNIKHTFRSQEPGLKIIYAQFKNNLNQESQTYSAVIRLVVSEAPSPSPADLSPTPELVLSPTPVGTGTSAP